MFAALCRAALAAQTHAEVNAINRRNTGKRQAFPVPRIRHQRIPTPSMGNRNRIALQISEGKYGPHKIGGAELLKSPFIQLW